MPPHAERTPTTIPACSSGPQANTHSSGNGTGIPRDGRAASPLGVVVVRDSKDPDGARVVMSRAGFRRLVRC
ncbi:DUF397 domain-containing protein [Actinomadura luteofluorescens]